MKNKAKKKSFHYTVWVDENQRASINEKILKSNLSNSTFFLAHIFNDQLKLPKLKELPKEVKFHLNELHKLSGLLSSLSIKSSKDKLVSPAWQESSQLIYYLVKLLFLYIMEDFKFPEHRKILFSIHSKIGELSNLMAMINEPEIVRLVDDCYEEVRSLINTYDSHYLKDSSSSFTKTIWQDNIDMKTQIESLKDKLLNL